MKKIFLILIFFTTILNASYKSKAREIYNFYKNSEYSAAAEIITAMTVLETGWYTSKYHNEYNNYYSKKISWSECKKKSKPIECMKIYETAEEANMDMLKYFKRKGYLMSTEGFYASLIKYGYAEDPKYIQKVKRVINTLKKRNIF